MLAVIDYGAGNLTSVKLALQDLGIEAVITDDAARIRDAERVVFPGVGAAGAAMRTLADLDLVQALRDVVRRGTPFLGICLGTQVIFDRSEEDGGVACIGLIPGTVRLFRRDGSADKVPHMGWNSVAFKRSHPVLAGIPPDSEFYFVHSYYPDPEQADMVAGETTYCGVTFASVLARDNLIATQFHPEKSGRIGLRILENFSRWNGKV